MTEHDLAPPARTGPGLDGRSADRVLVPGTVAEIQEMVAEARAAGTGLVPWGGGTAIHANVPLGEMFGYATQVRNMTQGRGSFTMEFEKYSIAPSNIADEVIKGSNS